MSNLTDEEEWLLETLPQEAWNLALAGRSKLEIVKALRNYGRVDLGLVTSVKLAEKMLQMLAK